MRKTYQTVRDILDHIRRIHEEAAGHCAAAQRGADDRLRLLAELFQDGQARLSRQVREVEAGGPGELLDTWVQFVPVEGVDKALRALRGEAGKHPDATFANCLALHEQLIGALRHLAETVPAPESREMLQHLADMEEQAMHQLGLADTMRGDG